MLAAIPFTMVLSTQAFPHGPWPLWFHDYGHHNSTSSNSTSVSQHCASAHFRVQHCSPSIRRAAGAVGSAATAAWEMKAACRFLGCSLLTNHVGAGSLTRRPSLIGKYSWDMSHDLDLRTALTVLRSQKRRKVDVGYSGSLHSSELVGSPMKQLEVQQWRPKVKAQSVSGKNVESIEANITSPPETAKEVAEHLNSDKCEEAQKVSISVEVNQAVIQTIKRYRAKVKRKIETQTKTSLSISKAKGGCYVVVEGSSEEAVQKAAKKLQDLSEKADIKKGHVEQKRDASKDIPSSTSDAATTVQASKGLGSGSLQWRPRTELRSIHTSSEAGNWDNLKAVLNNEEFESKDEEVEMKVSGSIQIDKKLLRLVKGKKNEVKKRIEQETSTTLQIGCPVVVEGSSEDSVQKALEEIQKVIDEAVNDSKVQYSHFVSLPLNMHPTLVKQLEAFQESVLTSLGIPLSDEEPVAADTVTEGEEDNNGVPEEGKGETQQQAEGNQLASGNVEMEHDSINSGAKEEILDEAFQVAVLNSLGIPLTMDETTSAGPVTEYAETKQGPMNSGAQEKMIDEVFQESVLTALGIPLAKDEQAAEDPVSEAEGIPEEGKEVLQTQSEDDHIGKGAPEERKDAVLCIESDQTEDEPLRQVSEEAEELPEVSVEAEEPKEYEPLPEVSLTTKKGSGVEKSLFIKPATFHLTVLMLKLWNEERVDKGCEVLQKCLPEVLVALEERPISITLKGLEIMRGSPKNTRVLYAKVAEADGGSRLHQACQVIIDAFIESGLVLGKDREHVLKMHATVMNTSHRRSKSKFKNKGFDATEFLAKYGEENWGEYQIMEAHLSQRFKYDENGYYHCCTSIPLHGSSSSSEATVVAESEGASKVLQINDEKLSEVTTVAESEEC